VFKEGVQKHSATEKLKKIDVPCEELYIYEKLAILTAT